MVKNSYILLLPVTLLVIFLGLSGGTRTPSLLQGSVISGGGEAPTILSSEDTERYQAAFAAQKEGDWKQADKALRGVGNTLLVGHMLAERYLDSRYRSTSTELARWLEHYADHPQAYTIYALALAKSPSLKRSLPELRKPATLSGYGGGHVSARFANENHGAAWRRAIQAWKAGKKDEAAKQFVHLADVLAKTPHATAAIYWAHRALAATGKHTEARVYLERAANGPHNFYSLLARRQLHLPLLADAEPAALGDGEWLKLTHTPATRRAIALAQVGAAELAENELRVMFPQADEEGKLQLLTLAHVLKLAPVQMVMATRLNKNARALDFALYPIPHWQPQDGFKIDPALVYALMRQESGFKPTAVSPNGAQGLMQLMPQTASMMQRLSGLPKDSAHDPEHNLELGQNYVRHLLDNGLVDGNLIYMLVAYNAGAGRLQEWKKTFDQEDPLLFVESIPFAETRGYVMQVMANYWVYSELTGETNRSLAALVRGGWPNYETTVPMAYRVASIGQAG